MKPPNVSVYAFSTQASDDSEKPRSSRIDGRATLTIETSRTISRSPRHSTISASHFLRVSSIVIGNLLVVAFYRFDPGSPRNSSVAAPMSFRRRKLS